MKEAREIGKKERRKQTESDGGKKVFCLWRIRAYGP